MSTAKSGNDWSASVSDYESELGPADLSSIVPSDS